MSEPVQIGDCTLYCGDALTVLPTLPPASVQLIVTDPPYFKTKMDYMGEKLTWDRQWPTREAYLGWLRQLAKEWQRVLTPNGSLYCFAAPQLAAHVEVLLGEVFHVIQRITWRKPSFSTKAEMFEKDALRMFFPASEAILFAEQAHADSMALGASGYAAQCEQAHAFVFEPLRQYLDGERRRAGISKAAINAACGFAPVAGAMASRHYFSASQWCLPTREHYTVMQHLFDRDGRRPAPPFQDYHPAGSVFFQGNTQARTSVPQAYAYLRQEYEALRQEYEALRQEYEALRQEYEALRRPFQVTKDVPYTDVFDFQTVPAGPGKHPCEKPLSMLRHIIKCSSREGDIVLDTCAGSFATLEAAQQLGRRGIGIEQDNKWYQHGLSRLSQQVLPMHIEE